jgi:hypothetical protein
MRTAMRIARSSPVKNKFPRSAKVCNIILVKMIAEYLEHALNFERMAAEETNPAIKAVFEKQAASYRRLIAERTKQFGLDDPRYSNR